jgi:thiamine pyrophosphokinase
LQPHLIIGDMDSLPGETQAALAERGCRFVIHPRAKDETDLELALTYAAEQGADEIIVLGALGGRLDHTLANILLLVLPQLLGIAVRIVDGNQEARLVKAGESACIEGTPGDLVSLLPLAAMVRGVSTDGLAWPLLDETLRLGFTRGVSNVMTSARARIDVGAGLLLVVHGPPAEN